MGMRCLYRTPSHPIPDVWGLGVGGLQGVRHIGHVGHLGHVSHGECGARGRQVGHIGQVGLGVCCDMGSTGGLGYW